MQEEAHLIADFIDAMCLHDSDDSDCVSSTGAGAGAGAGVGDKRKRESEHIPHISFY